MPARAPGKGKELGTRFFGASFMKKNRDIREKVSYEQLILKISLYAGMVFVLVEIGMSLWSHSQAILMDAVFDAAELIVIGLSLFLTPLFYQPVSEDKPYGYGQFESVFIIVKGFMLLSVTIGLIISNVQIMLDGGRHLDHRFISVLEFTLALGSGVVLLMMHFCRKKVSSPTVEAEIYGWKVDFTCSVGIGAAFFVQDLLLETPLAAMAPYFDQLVAVVIAACMLPQPLHMIFDAIRNLFLFSPGEEITHKVKTVSHRIVEDYGYTVNFCDVLITGRRMWVSIYFTPGGDVLSMRMLSEMSEQIEAALSEEFEDFSLELIPRSGSSDRSH